MERVAVTGAGGFLGGHLVRRLREEGVEIIPLVRAGDTSVDRALERPELLGKLDVLIHAAAVRHRHGATAKAYRASNVELPERILRAAAGRVRRFVLISSVGVYGFPEKLPIRETHPFAPATLYSATKVEAEKLVRELGAELGVEVVIVRPTIVYGKGDKNGMLDKMARMIRAGSYRIVGSGENVLHHTHVDDVVDGVLLAARSPAARGEDFILSGPETTTLAGLSDLVARAVGKKVPRLRVPLGFARAAATVVDVLAYRGLAFVEREPPINHEKLDVMTRSIAFDCGKAKERLGFAPKVSYAEGIRRTLDG